MRSRTPRTTDATRLVGPKPTGSVRTVSLAVKDYLDRYRPEGLVIGVSGGADSLALTVAAIDLAARRQLPLLATIIDHGIRPESAREARAVAALLQRLGAAEVVVAHPAQTINGEGPEGQARTRRHTELHTQARSFAVRHGLRSTDVLLGHTLDDQAETLLLGLARGSGLRSLQGMERRTDSSSTNTHVGRPLLGSRRADTLACCESLRLPVVHDPTNRTDSSWTTASGEPLRRAAVREWALPALARALGQDPAPALARTAAHLREDNDALDLVAARWVEQADIDLEPGIIAVRVTDIAQVPAAIRRRVWRIQALAVGAHPGAVTDRQLRDIDRLAVDWRGRGPVQLPGHASVRRDGDWLRFTAGNAVGE